MARWAGWGFKGYNACAQVFLALANTLFTAGYPFDWVEYNAYIAEINSLKSTYSTDTSKMQWTVNHACDGKACEELVAMYMEIKDITQGDTIDSPGSYTPCSNTYRYSDPNAQKDNWINYQYTDTWDLELIIIQLRRIWRLYEAGTLIYDKFAIINFHMYLQWDFNNQCVSPIPVDIGRTTIFAGNVLADWQTEVGFMGSFYMQERYAVYTGCAPGTWMTCIKDTGCSYQVPRRQDENIVWVPDDNTWQVPTSTNPIIPIGKCYDCIYATYTNHYQNNPNKCGNTFDPNNPECNNLIMDPRTFGSLYCLGNDKTPLICPPLSVSSADHSHCICQDGYYNPNGNDNTNCVICPTGHYCTQNKLNVCPDGTYQYFEGKTQCDLCDIDGNPIWKCGANQLPAKCTLANDPVNFLYLSQLTCVSCSQCRNKIIDSTLPPGQSQNYLDCYDV